MNDPFSKLNFGISMGRNIFQKPIFANLTQILQKCRKIGTNFAKMSQNRDKFLIFGKCMGPIIGQNLVYVWVNFHFPSGTSLQKKILSKAMEPRSAT